MQTSKQMRPLNWCYVFCIFAVLGTAVAYAVFGPAPASISGCLIAGIATGFAGIISWALICGVTRIPDRVIACCAGIVTGVLLHPIYFFLTSGLEGLFLSLKDLILGSCFSLLVIGIITIPAGIFASMLIREILEINSPTISTDETDL